eukprot:9494960-Pyramimonas_sp.AAC.1
MSETDVYVATVPPWAEQNGRRHPRKATAITSSRFRTSSAVAPGGEGDILLTAPGLGAEMHHLSH